MDPISYKQELAQRCMRGHRWKEAIPILQNDIHENGHDPWSHMYLGSCYYVLHNYTEALKWFQSAEGVDPENPTPYGLQGYALDCLGREEEAEAAYLKALEIDPDDSLAKRNWSRLTRRHLNFAGGESKRQTADHPKHSAVADLPLADSTVTNTACPGGIAAHRNWPDELSSLPRISSWNNTIQFSKDLPSLALFVCQYRTPQKCRPSLKK